MLLKPHKATAAAKRGHIVMGSAAIGHIVMGNATLGRIVLGKTAMGNQQYAIRIVSTTMANMATRPQGA